LKRYISVAALSIFLLCALPAATADTFSLTKVAETSSTITFTYPQQDGYGYLYSANGTVVARSNDPTKTRVKFNKADSYEVAAIVKGTTGSYTIAPPPPPPPPPSGSITQTITEGSTISDITGWRAVYDANGDGTEDDPGSVKFYVDGTLLLSEINAPFGDTFIDGSIAVADGQHTFKVEAVSDAGAVLVNSSVTANVKSTVPPPPPPPPPSSSCAVSTPGVADGPDGMGGCFPGPSNTGTPDGAILHSCDPTINTSGTYDLCQFNGAVEVNASNVKITRSLILGPVRPSDTQTGLVIQDTTINCQCLSTNDNDTPVGIMENNYTLIRVDLYNAGHGAAAKNNVVIQDSYIHGLGGNTQAHKDGIFVGDGHNQRFIHNTVECNDGPDRGCSAAIGIFDDFSDVYNVTVDSNLLNTNGAYCFYASGGPEKSYVSHDITFTNNRFGRKFETQCGVLGPVTYWDASKPGMVWSGNVWADTGVPVGPEY